jgi:hypothetical protein
VLLDAAVLAIIVGLIAGGQLRRLPELDLRAPWLFVAAAAVQLALIVAAAQGWMMGDAAAGCLHIFTYLLLAAALWANRHLWPMRVAGIGVLLNLLVIAANGGTMPVDRELAVRAGSNRLVAMLDSESYYSHRATTAGTRLRPLADVLPLPLLVPRPRFFSPGSVGDIFVTIGGCWLILTGLGAFGLRGKRMGDS